MVLFCAIRPRATAVPVRAGIRRGEVRTKKEEPHFCGSKGEKVYEKVFFLRTIIVYRRVV